MLRNLPLLISLALTTHAVAQVPATKPRTVSDLIPVFISQSLVAPVRYCETAAPGLASSVRSAESALRPELERAMRDYLAWVPANEDELVTPELEDLLEKAQAQLMDEVRRREPYQYCKGLADRYLSIDASRLLMQAKAGYSQFKAMQSSNPSIERTAPGKPGAASHVKR